MKESTDPNEHLQPGFSNDELVFIKEHLHDDVSKLILQSEKFTGIDIKKLAGQILSRQKAVKKLPEWYSNENLIFPPALSVEQSSSEATARFKGHIVSGQTLIDITGGMGVDCYYMSKNFETIRYFEQQTDVANTARYNLSMLNSSRIHVQNTDSIAEISSKKLQADWIYADPARRDNNKEKVVKLADCTPDVASHIGLLLEAAPNILIKTSPLLDIDLAVKELKNVNAVYVIGYEQECKELLFHVSRAQDSDTFKIKVRILDPNGTPIHVLDFDRFTEQSSTTSYCGPQSFLYEPHAAILKAGAFKTAGSFFGLNKLASSSHLYTSEKLVPGFPGRSFEILGICKPDSKEIRQFIHGDKANLTLRNFPAKIHDLRKKWRLKEGGDFYLFGTTLHDSKKVIIISKKL